MYLVDVATEIGVESCRAVHAQLPVSGRSGICVCVLLCPFVSYPNSHRSYAHFYLSVRISIFYYPELSNGFFHLFWLVITST